MTRYLCSLAVIFTSAVVWAGELASDDAIRQTLIERVGKNENCVGILVKIITPAGERMISHGHRDAGDTRQLDGDTVFEIGSVTKVFTALLLADAVQRHEMALDDPASKYLPGGTTLPARSNRPITLLDLATHTSGLPFMPEMRRP